jgi:hypothetical protein
VPLFLVFAITFVTTWARAEPVPVIEAGREQEILALFHPHQLGKEVTPGWKLWDVNVSPRGIRVECHGPNAGRAAMRLVHPGGGGGDGVHAKSFLIQRESGGDPAGSAALEKLTAAVVANDGGGFFRSMGVPRVEVAPNRTRFLAIPIATFVLALAGMLLARRIRGQRA